MAIHQQNWTDEQLLLTVEEVARALNVGRTTVYALIKDGQLHTVHIGRSCRLTRAELRRYVTQLDAPAAAPKPKTRRTRQPRGASQRGLFDLDTTPPDAA